MCWKGGASEAEARQRKMCWKGGASEAEARQRKMCRKGGASEAEAGEQRFGKTDFLYQFFCLRHVPDMFPAMAVAG